MAELRIFRQLPSQNFKRYFTYLLFAYSSQRAASATLAHDGYRVKTGRHSRRQPCSGSSALLWVSNEIELYSGGLVGELRGGS